MPNVDVTLTISDTNIERVCLGYLRMWTMPKDEQGQDVYPTIEDWISVELEDYLLQIVNRGLVLLAQESSEPITSL